MPQVIDYQEDPTVARGHQSAQAFAQALRERQASQLALKRLELDKQIQTDANKKEALQNKINLQKAINEIKGKSASGELSPAQANSLVQDLIKSYGFDDFAEAGNRVQQSLKEISAYEEPQQPDQSSQDPFSQLSPKAKSDLLTAKQTRQQNAIKFPVDLARTRAETGKLGGEEAKAAQEAKQAELINAIIESRKNALTGNSAEPGQTPPGQSGDVPNSGNSGAPGILFPQLPLAGGGNMVLTDDLMAQERAKAIASKEGEYSVKRPLPPDVVDKVSKGNASLALIGQSLNDFVNDPTMRPYMGPDINLNVFARRLGAKLSNDPVSARWNTFQTQVGKNLFESVLEYARTTFTEGVLNKIKDINPTEQDTPRTFMLKSYKLIEIALESMRRDKSLRSEAGYKTELHDEAITQLSQLRDIAAQNLNSKDIIKINESLPKELPPAPKGLGSNKADARFEQFRKVYEQMKGGR